MAYEHGLTLAQAALLCVLGVVGLLVLFALSNNRAANNALKKLQLYCFKTGFYFILSKDSKWPKSADPDTWQFEKDGVSEVRVLFIRHGESVWNDIFNKGFGPGFLIRVIGGLLREISLLDTPDSVLVDSPLSRTGYKQSYDLARFVERVENSPALEKDLAILRGQTPGTIVVSSNLRRAIETVTIGLWSRLKRGREKVHIMSDLQEISRNVDTMSFADAHEVPDVHKLREQLTGWEPNCYDPSLNYGNKTLKRRGGLRLQQFAEWASNAQNLSDGTRKQAIIVGGHSLWFRKFFREYLPHSCKHECKTRKIVNCGVIGFTLTRIGTSHGAKFRIDPATIATVYGGYTGRLC